MKKLLFLLFVSAILLNHNAMAISALQYASRSTKAELDVLLKKAEKSSVSKEEAARIRTLYVSLRQTQPKTAVIVRDKIQKTETLATILPDIAGTQKIISTKTGTALTQTEKREITKKAVVKTDDVITKYEQGEIDQVEVKEELTATGNVTASLDVIENTNITENVKKEIEKHKNIKRILDDEDIEVDDFEVAKKEDDLEDEFGFGFHEEPEAKKEVVSTQTEKILAEIRQELLIHIQTSDAAERFDAYKKIAQLISDYVGAKGDQEEIKLFRITFIEQLIENIKTEFKTFEKSYVELECERLDVMIGMAEQGKNIANLKKNIKGKNASLVKEYGLYVFPVVNNLMKIKDIFKNPKQINLIFGNEITDEQKEILQILVRRYILGTLNPTNPGLQQYNNYSIGGLLDRHVNYINTVFLAHKDPNDRADLLALIKNDGIITILRDAQTDLIRQFLGVLDTQGEDTLFMGILREKLSKLYEAIESDPW